MKLNINTPAVAIIAFLALSGCAAFEKNKLDRLSDYPDVSSFDDKPSVYVDLSMYEGTPDSGAKETEELSDDFIAIFDNTINESGLFSSYSFEDGEIDAPDYTLKIDVYNHYNAPLIYATSFITGYSFGMIPSTASDNYTLVLSTIDNDGNIIDKQQNEDAIRIWSGVWFLPWSGNTPKKATENTLSNQLQVALNELIKSNKLQYSENDLENFGLESFFEPLSPDAGVILTSKRAECETTAIAPHCLDSM